MKITKNYIRQVIKECMADMMSAEPAVEVIDIDSPDHDEEGRMAKNNLFKLAKYSTQLHNMIKDGDNLEPWVEEKIAVAAEAIKTIADYMEYENIRGSR